MKSPTKLDLLELLDELKSPINCLWHPSFVIQSTKYWFRLKDDDLFRYAWFNILHEVGHSVLDMSNYKFKTKKLGLSEYEVRMWVCWVCEAKGWIQPTQLDYIPKLMKHSLKMTEPNYNTQRFEGKLKAFYEQYDYDLFKDKVNFDALSSIGISDNNYIRNDLEQFMERYDYSPFGFYSYYPGMDLEYVISQDSFNYPDRSSWDERKQQRTNPYVKYVHSPNGANNIQLVELTQDLL